MLVVPDLLARRYVMSRNVCDRIPPFMVSCLWVLLTPTHNVAFLACCMCVCMCVLVVVLH